MTKRRMTYNQLDDRPRTTRKDGTMSTFRSLDGGTAKRSAVIALHTEGGGMDPGDWTEDLPIIYIATIQGGTKYKVSKEVYHDLERDFR